MSNSPAANRNRASSARASSVSRWLELTKRAQQCRQADTRRGVDLRKSGIALFELRQDSLSIGELGHSLFGDAATEITTREQDLGAIGVEQLPLRALVQVRDQPLKALGKEHGQNDVRESVSRLECIEAFRFVRQTQIRGVFVRGAQHESRVDIRAKTRIELPDEVAPVMIRAEDLASRGQVREARGTHRRNSKRTWLRQPRLTPAR